jgi:hypothetical protein
LEKLGAINFMLTTCIIDRLKSRDWAANTLHSEIQKHANGGWPFAHYLVDEHVRFDGARLLGHLVNVSGSS